GAGDECGTMQLSGLGVADWAYVFGPAFVPDGRCFDVDGTLTITLQSDGSTISGPLTGVLCPRASGTGHQHGGPKSYGNPFVEAGWVARVAQHHARADRRRVIPGVGGLDRERAVGRAHDESVTGGVLDHLVGVRQPPA